MSEGEVTSEATEFSVESARAAARQNGLRDWVRRFLGSPGSDNAVLATELCEELGYWAGPVELPLDQLHRLAGPKGDPVLCEVDEDYWDDRVEKMDNLAERGWDPPPVIVAFRDGRFVLEDGNHRVESVRQAGRDATWAIVGFTEQGERDDFVSQQMNRQECGNSDPS
jgi:hypothetical protein